MRDREIICKYYTYEGGSCDKRNISVHFKDECQTCKTYSPLRHGRPARVDRRRAKEERVNRKEFNRNDY